MNVGHLESGRIRPNVETLKSLSAALGLLYGQLAVEAGYIIREEFETPIDEGQLARLTEIGALTEEEWESVKDFSRFRPLVVSCEYLRRVGPEPR